MLRNQF